MPSHWRRRPGTGERPEFLHGYDAVRAYIAAAMLAEVSPWALKPDRLGMPFDRRRAGWWLVELAPWNLGDKMPDPAGYLTFTGADDPRRRVRWVTTPTLVLLDELAREGVYGGFKVLESVTGPARDYPLRMFAERMRDAYLLGLPRIGREPLRELRRYKLLDDGDKTAVRAALKMVGHETFGAFDKADATTVRRPHWWYTIVAMHRANLWRKAWRVGNVCGVWPLYFDTDLVWYGSDVEDPHEAAKLLQFVNPRNQKPAGILTDPNKPGLALGTFVPKRIQRRREPVAA